jgi:hypothetical protein
VREITEATFRKSGLCFQSGATIKAWITPTRIKPVAVSNANQHLKKHEQVAVTTKNTTARKNTRY